MVTTLSVISLCMRLDLTMPSCLLVQCRRKRRCTTSLCYMFITACIAPADTRAPSHQASQNNATILNGAVCFATDGINLARTTVILCELNAILALRVKRTAACALYPCSVSREHTYHAEREGMRRPTSDCGRVTWVILGNVLLNLADQIGSNISSLGVDSSSHSSKQSNGGTTQTIPGDGLVQTMPVIAKDLCPRDNAG